MKFTARQKEAQKLFLSEAIHILLYGGSRSGKTFQIIRNIVARAIKAPGSRHAILRFRFSHLKQSIIYDTFPKVLALCFPTLRGRMNKSDWFFQLDNGAEIWFGGLDDKERTDKILGNEYVTIFLNEVSQISREARDTVKTRLAQKVYEDCVWGKKLMKPRMYYDCNPPNKSHWTYKTFHDKLDVETKEPLPDPEHYAMMQMNPIDNAENISDEYMQMLASLSTRHRKRFMAGEFADATPNQLFTDETIDKWRVLDGDTVPDFVRVVVAVDPSGADDRDNTDNDEIGIVVAGLGTDGNAYVIEDCTVKAGPAVWGKVAVDAYDRHKGDIVVGEQNFGGAMVKFTIQVARSKTPYKSVTASRGKAVRAEPISALYEAGKVSHVGVYPELEDELSAFSTTGYLGDDSPNRADALIWALTELFAGIVNPRHTVTPSPPPPVAARWGKPGG